MSPRLLLPVDVDHDAEAVALQWLRDTVWKEWSDEELRTFLRGMTLAKLDLSGAVRKSRERLNNVRDFLEELLKEGGAHAVRAVMDAVILPPFEICGELANEITKVGQVIRSHRNFQRAAQVLELPPRLRRAIDGEVRRRLAVLEKTRQLGESLGLDLTRRAKQSPQRALPVVRLAEVFIVAGFSKRQSFERTAALLRAYDPARYGDLKADQVRLRHTRFSSPSRSDETRDD